MTNKQTISERTADNIRALVHAMVERAGTGHAGGALGIADFIGVLYGEYLITDPDDPEWPQRDRFFLDPGHMCAALYAALAMQGRLTMEELKGFRKLGSLTPGHTELDPAHGIENTSGPLGQGHTYAVGAAIAAKVMQERFGSDIARQHIYTLISDGGIQEEISSGAGRLAGALGLDNLTMYYDSNGVQSTDFVRQVDPEDVAQKYRAWGWEVVTADGSDHDQIRRALDHALSTKGRPTLIIGRETIAYKTVSLPGKAVEGSVPTHSFPMSYHGADLPATYRLLGADPENPFAIYSDVREFFDKTNQRNRRLKEEWVQGFRKWQSENPALSEELRKWLDGSYYRILPWDEIAQEPDSPTNAAGGKALRFLTERCPNFIALSADLGQSDKTQEVKSVRGLIEKDHFGSRFLNVGVSELTMAGIAAGIALHGGCRVACGTFLAFSDYQKPVLRMTALMGLPVLYVWSHDDLLIGADGATHQPVEQELQVRLLAKMRNPHGDPAMLVLRPSDARQTTECWKMAIENLTSPTGLIECKHPVPGLPEYDVSLAAKGGVTVLSVPDPEAVLLATGNEAALLAKIAARMNAEGRRLNVASFPSPELFREQPKAYREKVLPPGVPRFGLTYGLSYNLLELVPEESGMILGADAFGASAEADDLTRSLGLDEVQITAALRSFLSGQPKE